MIILKDGWKLCDRIQYLFMIKHLSLLRVERIFRNLIETAMKYLQVIIILDVSHRDGNKAGILHLVCFPTFFWMF